VHSTRPQLSPSPPLLTSLLVSSTAYACWAASGMRCARFRFRFCCWARFGFRFDFLFQFEFWECVFWVCFSWHISICMPPAALAAFCFDVVPTSVPLSLPQPFVSALLFFLLLFLCSSSLECFALLFISTVGFNCGTSRTPCPLTLISLSLPSSKLFSPLLHASGWSQTPHLSFVNLILRLGQQSTICT